MVEKGHRQPDDKHVEITMTKPYNALLYTLPSWASCLEHAHRGVTVALTDRFGPLWGLSSGIAASRSFLKANPDYYGEAPKMERVVVVFMEEDAALLAVRAGQADIATSATYSDQTSEGYEFFFVRNGRFAWNFSSEHRCGADQGRRSERISCRQRPLRDLTVRRAINYGVDRQAMIDNVLNGYGTPAYSVCDSSPVEVP